MNRANIITLLVIVGVLSVILIPSIIGYKMFRADCDELGGRYFVTSAETFCTTNGDDYVLSGTGKGDIGRWVNIGNVFPDGVE